GVPETYFIICAWVAVAPPVAVAGGRDDQRPILAELRNAHPRVGRVPQLCGSFHYPQNRVKWLHLKTCGRGQRHGVTSFCLSARPVRPPLARPPRAPPPAQAPGDSPGRDRPARAYHTQAAPLQRAQPLRGPAAQASWYPV